MLETFKFFIRFVKFNLGILEIWSCRVRLKQNFELTEGLFY